MIHKILRGLQENLGVTGRIILKYLEEIWLIDMN
jgi:hypothetical protein